MRLPALLLGPALLVNLAIFIAPMANLAALSFHEARPSGGVGPGPTLATWASIAEDEYYIELVTGSIGVALGVTVLTLLAGYPLALFIHRAAPRWRNLLMVACISPLLVSAVVRTYGWMVILGDTGLVAAVLRFLGMAKPPRMVFNLTGVVIALVEILMPTMILCLLAGFGRLNASLEEAAASLGAPRWRVFMRVVLPLSLPGVLLGCLLAFVLTVSSFITPKLLGGGRVILLATEIYDQAIVTLNWPVAAALSVLSLAVFGLALLLYGRLLRMVEA
ncbi:MAG: ABC transporter permease [Alphaproteobacteria bacterium]|nr:ABC transporter permease [Alphaproteobacteria bacterium]